MIGLLTSGVGPLKMVLIVISTIVLGAALVNRSPLDDWAVEKLAYGWLVAAIWAIAAVALLRRKSRPKTDRTRGLVAISLAAAACICVMGNPEDTGLPLLRADQAGLWGAMIAGSSLTLLVLKVSLLTLFSLILISRKVQNMVLVSAPGLFRVTVHGINNLLLVLKLIWANIYPSRLIPLIDRSPGRAINCPQPGPYKHRNGEIDEGYPHVGAPNSSADEDQIELLPQKGVAARPSDANANWVLPKQSLLYRTQHNSPQAQPLDHWERLVQKTLSEHGVEVTIENLHEGPRTINMGIVPGWTTRARRSHNSPSETDGLSKPCRVKVQTVLSRKNDLALALGTPSIRLQSPAPGKSWIGLEIAKDRPPTVHLGDVSANPGFPTSTSDRHLPVVLGIGSDNTPVTLDLADLPHILVGGETGSGKSACLNSMVCSLLMTKTPDEVRLLMVDPKRVEFSTFSGLPHLLSPVVVDAYEARNALASLVEEMHERLRRMQTTGAKDIQTYNLNANSPMPYIVTFIDEFAYLVSGRACRTNDDVLRIAQMGRAAGIHLVLSTQRPSVDVIPGTIKANLPARIAFSMSSAADSRVVLDNPGAELLLGRGDMLLKCPDAMGLIRVQGAMTGSQDTPHLVDHWLKQTAAN